jgi:hypothetical protein
VCRVGGCDCIHGHQGEFSYLSLLSHNIVDIAKFFSTPSSSPPLLSQSKIKCKNKKQKRNQSAGEEKVPRDVYVGADGNHYARDVDDDEEEYYANEDKNSSSVSRVASIRSSLSRGIRSKFGKKNQTNDTGDYQAPV